MYRQCLEGGGSRDYDLSVPSALLFDPKDKKRIVPPPSLPKARQSLVSRPPAPRPRSNQPPGARASGGRFPNAQKSALEPFRHTKKVRAAAEPVPVYTRGHRERRAKILNRAELPACMASLFDLLWKTPCGIARVIRYWLDQSQCSPAKLYGVLMQSPVELTVNQNGITLLAGLPRLPFSRLDKGAVATVVSMIPRASEKSEIWEDDALCGDSPINSLSKCIWNDRLTAVLPRHRLLAIYMVVMGTAARAFLPSLSLTAAEAKDYAVKQTALSLVIVLSTCTDKQLPSYVLSCADEI